MGSKSHRYGAIGRESQHYAIDKAVGLRNFPHLHERHAFLRNSTEFFSNSNNVISFKFSEADAGQVFCRFLPKNPTHAFIVSTKSRPNFAENQISNFHISQKWEAIGPNPQPSLSDPQGGKCRPLRGHTAAILAKKCLSKGLWRPNPK